MSAEEIAAVKQAARDEDARSLAAGEVSVEELRQRNAVLAPFREVRVRSGAKRLR